MAERLPQAGEKAGAEVRLRQVAELAPAGGHRLQRGVEPALRQRPRTSRRPTADDIVWADAVLFGTPTRYGNVASQLKQFIDTLGPQWGAGSAGEQGVRRASPPR